MQGPLVVGVFLHLGRGREPDNQSQPQEDGYDPKFSNHSQGLNPLFGSGRIILKKYCTYC
jgi:hypothetical protein